MMPIRSLLRPSRRIGPASLNTTPLHPALCRERLVAEGKPSCICSICCIPVNPFMRRRPQKEAGFRHGARRAALWTEVLRRYAGESVAETADDGICPGCADTKMEERHILREDAVRGYAPC